MQIIIIGSRGRYIKREGTVTFNKGVQENTACMGRAKHVRKLEK